MKRYIKINAIQGRIWTKSPGAAYQSVCIALIIIELIMGVTSHKKIILCASVIN